MFIHMIKVITDLSANVTAQSYNPSYNWTNTCVQRTHTKQLCAPLTTTLEHPKSMQCNFNSCSFNYKFDYIILRVRGQQHGAQMQAHILRDVNFCRVDLRIVGKVHQHLKFSSWPCIAWIPCIHITAQTSPAPRSVGIYLICLIPRTTVMSPSAPKDTCYKTHMRQSRWTR